MLRRKWPFEKGRNSSSIIFAAVVTTAVVAVVVFGFRYVHKNSVDQRQTTEVSLISEQKNNFLEVLDYFDPANTFGINNGGQPFCLFCRRSHHANSCSGAGLFIDLNTAENPPIPEFTSDFKIVPMAKNELYLPTASGPVRILPVPGKRKVVTTSHRIVDDNGKVFELEKLDKLNAGTVSKPTILQLTGNGLLARVRIIRSCGNKKLDLECGHILKASGIEPGTYTINWNRSGGN